MRAVLSVGVVSRLHFHAVQNSKDVPCFTEVSVHSSPGAVAFLSECLQGRVVLITPVFCSWLFFFFLAFVGCVGCVCVRVLAGAPGTRRCIFLYKLESGSVAES